MFDRCVPLVLGLVLAISSSFAAAAEDLTAIAPEYPDEGKAMIAASLAFFERVEAESSPQTRVPVIGIPLSATKSSVQPPQGEGSILTRMGPVDHLTGYRVTWYPIDTLYGTVDFMGTWNDNRNLVCGYLRWDLSDPEAPELVTVEASFVDLAALTGASDTQITRSLIEANCAFGAIDANYRVFDVTG